MKPRKMSAVTLIAAAFLLVWAAGCVTSMSENERWLWDSDAMATNTAAPAMTDLPQE